MESTCDGRSIINTQMKGPESAGGEAVAEGPAITSQDPCGRPSDRQAACSSTSKGQNLVVSFGKMRTVAITSD